ncbi:MAG: hypothetical protein LBD89_06805 [Tannerellaceae bacterium]|jgi:hypothetical protein|nr:hypothetical protein [Tannerellaceae bacterium]
MKASILFLLLLLAAPGRSEVRERIYLQTDKQVYLSGEHLWMKLYLTNHQGKPIDLSKVGYVELLNGSQPQIQVKLEISDGLGQGWMELPSRLPSGYYHLIAYTRYMQNEGAEVYFRKTIGIVNTYRTDRSVPTDTSLVSPAPDILPVAEAGVSVRPSAPAYPLRSQGELHIKGLPADLHSLAVSVAGSEFIPVPETTDIVRWSTQIASLPQADWEEKNFIRPEYEGHIIQGRMVDAQTGEPLPAKAWALMGFAGDDIRLFGSEVNEQSSAVTFYTERIGGKRRVGLAAFPNEEGKACRIELQSPFVTHSPLPMPSFAVHPAWEEALVQRSVGVQTLYSFTYDSISRTTPSESCFRWQPDVRYLLDEYTRFAQMQEMFVEFIPYLTFRTENGLRRLSVILRDFSPGHPSLVLLDGIPIPDHTFLYNYDVRRLKRVDVYRDPFYFGGRRFEGIASFTSFRNDHPTLASSTWLRLTDYEGTQLRRSFYAPAYCDGDRSPVPDYRHTLLWAPEVRTNGTSTLTLPFTTSDFTGSFLITVEGLTRDGRPIRATASFTVEGGG